MRQIGKAEQPSKRNDRQNFSPKVCQPLQRGGRQRHPYHLRNPYDFLHRHHVGRENLVACNESDKLLGALPHALLRSGSAFVGMVLVDAGLIRLCGRGGLDDRILVDARFIRLFAGRALVEDVFLEKRRPIGVLLR